MKRMEDAFDNDRNILGNIACFSYVECLCIKW